MTRMMLVVVVLLIVVSTAWAGVQLPAPFLAQGSDNMNCGPCCLAMAACYVNGSTPDQNMVEQINAVIPAGDKDLKGCDDLIKAGEDPNVFGRTATYDSSCTMDKIRAELKSGGVVIVGVNAGVLGNPHYAVDSPDHTGYKDSHFVLVTGYDDDGNIIVNDPGTRYGGNWKYGANTFEQAMNKDGAFALFGFRKDNPAPPADNPTKSEQKEARKLATELESLSVSNPIVNEYMVLMRRGKNVTAAEWQWIVAKLKQAIGKIKGSFGVSADTPDPPNREENQILGQLIGGLIINAIHGRGKGKWQPPCNPADDSNFVGTYAEWQRRYGRYYPNAKPPSNLPQGTGGIRYQVLSNGQRIPVGKLGPGGW